MKTETKVEKAPTVVQEPVAMSPAHRVLIVDDSPTMRRQLADWLAAAGFAVSTAEDAAAGIKALTEPDAESAVDLVFVDYNMPGMTGLEMIEAVQASLAESPCAARQKPAFVMLTAESSSQMVLRAKELGARGWLTKPTTRDSLVRVAQKLTAS